MKKIACLLLACMAINACNPPRYSYVAPTLNTTAYSRAGEGQLGILFGSPGIGAKGGIAITPNINVNAWGATLPGNNGDYNAKEAEFSVGAQTNPTKNGEVTSFFAGLSTGRNHKDRAALAGNFNRAFLQIQQSSIDAAIGNARLDGYFGFQVNYLTYEGIKGAQPFADNLWYYQPYFGLAFGGHNVRVEMVQGITFKNTGEWSHGVRIFPWFGHIGMLVKFRKHTPGRHQPAPITAMHSR